MSTNDAKISQMQGDVDEVVDVMRANFTKVVEREQKLENLEQNSNNLRDNAELFVKKSKVLKKKMWWKNVRLMIALAIICSIILGIIILVIALQFKDKKGSSNNNEPNTDDDKDKTNANSPAQTNTV